VPVGGRPEACELGGQMRAYSAQDGEGGKRH
jgi:hypothetical protein